MEKPKFLEYIKKAVLLHTFDTDIGLNMYTNLITIFSTL